MVLSVVFYTFVAFTAIQIFYYFFFSSFLFTKKKGKQFDSEEGISVLIFVKNSAKKLQNNLPFILAQEYPKFEIVLINNASTDNTDETIETFKEKNDNITILDVENNEAFWANKKYAITLGIKAAKYNNLVFTDANSKPISTLWLTEISKKFTNNKSIILGYSKFETQKSIFNILVRFENLLKAIQGFSFTKSGASYTAFGNNLAYKKTDFFNVKGFINHIKIKNDDGDLFLKDASTKKNTTFVISDTSFVTQNISFSFSKWFYNLRIKNSIKQHYKLKNRLFLNLFTFSKIIFFALAIFLFFYNPWQKILPVVLAYYLVQFIVIGLSAKKLKEPYIILLLPFLEISLVLIQISIFSVNLISKPNHWKKTI